MDSALSANALLSVFMLMAVTLTASVITAKTAKSKGFNFWLFFLLSFVSWLVMAIIAIVLAPKTEARKTKRSSYALLILGIVIEFVGFARLPLDPSMTDIEILNSLGSQESLGAIVIAAAGILVVIGAVTNERVHLKSEVRSL